MRLPLFISIGLALCIGLYCPEVQAKSRLIGIWNALTPASNPAARLGKQTTDAAIVRFAKTKKTISKGAPFALSQQLPMTIELLFDAQKKSDNTIEPYVLTISEDAHCEIGCPPDKICVAAKVGGAGSDSEEGKAFTCVNTSVYYIKPGDLPFQWQNVMLFLADNPLYRQDKTSFPFKIGLAAWTSTNGIWAKNTLNAAPSDDKTNAPQVNFSQPLRVFQGHQAWGGGPIPRMYHGCIAHIYNNSENIIMVRRNHPRQSTAAKDLSPYNFEKLVPPFSVVPFAMVWPSKIDANQKDKVSNLPVEFLMMGISKQRPLPIFKPIGVPMTMVTQVSDTIPSEGAKPAFEELNKANLNAQQGALNNKYIDDLASRIMQNMSAVAEDISGYNEFIDDMKVDKAQQYMVGTNSYKIFSTKDPKNTLYIKECPLDSINETIIYTHPTPAFNAATGMPNFLRLIISEKDGKPEFDLKDISIEGVY